MEAGEQPPFKWQDAIHKLLIVNAQPIESFTANLSRKSIQSLKATHHSTIDPSVDPKQLWKRIANPAISPKLQSFMWLLNNKGIWSGAKVSKWANAIVPCTRCQHPNETLEHSFWSCPPVQQFWTNILARLSIIPSADFNWKSIVTLSYILHSGKASITNHISIISALWAIHSTRIASIYNDKPSDHQHIFNSWSYTLQNIIRAKYRTALTLSSTSTFRHKWQWLCDALNVNFHSPLSTDG